MFTVKLASGESFPISTAEQARRGGDLAGPQPLSLRAETTPAEHGLEWYLERLEAPGALDTVEILLPDGSVGIRLQGYSQVSDISLRLLVTGEKSLTLVLTKPVGSSDLEQELDL